MPPAVKVQSLNDWTVREVPLPTESDRPFLFSHLNFEGVLKESSPVFLQHHLLGFWLHSPVSLPHFGCSFPVCFMTSSLSYT